ncbi:C2 domain-containing protein [Collybia nuda]|uniref:C2 domain-containing protein n=1 Tax=Collybia nuda TaxID=64659 RepID=A0A9P6CDP0_9AGAR|nr:C2 domain-containing protein [Collybia nuda]
MATNGLHNGLAEANAVLQQDQGRVAVHSFDPSATPAEKSAAAGKGRDQLKSANYQEGAGEREVQIDAGGPNIIPTISIQDTDGEHKLVASDTPQSVQEVQQDSQAIPGALSDTVAPAIPDWYKVGWRQAAGIDNAPLAEGEEKDKGVLDLFLSEQFYGSWYHNAAIIIFAVFASHFLTRFNFGWGWLFIILAVCNTYYSTSLERVRRRARDDIQRELVKTRLASEHESADWINNFLDRFWLIYEPVLSATVVSSVDQILSTNTPPFLDSLRLSQFTLGTKAPRIDKVRTFPKTPDDIIMMDWGISFTPNDISDLTPRQAADKVNPKIVLSVRVGKGLATALMPILIEDISFSGLMRIRMKLMSSFPHVQIVDFCFLEKPVIDYVLKPVGGETFGFDIGNIPGLSAFIREMTHATLGPMMYDPNVFTLNLEQMLSGKPSDTAIGVLQVTVQSARGIKGTKIGGGTPDPYVSLTINDRVELARTKYKTNTFNPTWMETKFLLVNALNESLVLNLWDYNDHRKNTLMSSSTFELSKLAEDATQEGIVAPLLKDGKERGELRYDISFYPVLETEEDKDAGDSSVGIVRLTIHQAKELDHTKSMTGDLNPIAWVLLGGSAKPVHKTRCIKHTNSPIWESAYEFLCPDKGASIVGVRVIDDRDFMKDTSIGHMSIKLTDLLASRGEAGRDWFPLSGCKSGKLKVSAEWKPLNMAGSLHGSEQYQPPIGVIRLLLDKATDVKNVEATLGGKSDPYMRVQVNNVTKGRTEVVNNNLNPVWDQIVYVPVHSLKENLMLECMDYQNLTRDRSLGSVELHVSELAKESGETRYLYESTGIKKATDPFRLDKGNVYKGQLHYTAEFVPALALKGVKFESQPNEIQKASEKASRDEDGGDAGDSSSMYSSSDEEHGPIPITIKTLPPRDGSPPKNNPTNESVDSVHTSSTNDTAHTAETSTGNTKDADGVEMSIEELLAQQSGIIVFNVISGALAKKARLEVLLDDGYWPCFTTVKARSTEARWEYVGEGFIKEIDFSRVWLRLNEADEGDKDDIIAEWKGDAKPFLQSTLVGPHTVTLYDQDERYASTITLEARYVPVPVKLEPRETINNQGILRIDLLDGHEIHGIDRGGKSDPYAVFTLNGQKVFKSQTKKKTLNPEWNENFTISVPSRVNAELSVEIFDWNQIEQAKSLGTASIDIEDIEPFQATERLLNLVSTKHGEKGQIRVRLMFQPEIIAKSRKNTSTFSTAGRAMTQIGGLPVTAGKGVLHGVAGVFRKSDREQETTSEMPTSSGQASQPVGLSDNLEARGAAFPTSKNSMDSAPNEPGTLRVTVLDAKDLSSHDCKPYATIRIGDKEFKTKHVGKTATPEWNESFVFAAGALTPKLFAWIHDHKTLGKDKELGAGEVDIWRHIQPEGMSSADVFLELRQGGLLRIRLEFDATTNPSNASINSGSGERMSRTVSIASPSRFSIGRRRPATEQDD